MDFRVAFVGTGPDPADPDRDGFAMAYRHAAAYRDRDDCTLIACSDIERDHAEAFAGHHNISDSLVYEDHRRMIQQTNPDIVSVCVPPSVHAEIVIDCAHAGDIRAIHCEKPMATTWEDCREMVAVCAEENVQLTIDHQRRFSIPVREAKKLLDEGRIGTLRRLEWSEVNLFDAGSHLFDLCDFFTEGARAEWVLAGIDISEQHRWFGTLNSNQAIVHWSYGDDLQGIASTADGGQSAVDAYLRIIGSEGEIEIQPHTGPPLRIRTDGGWNSFGTDGESLYGPPGSRLQGAMSKIQSLAPGDSFQLPNRPNYARAINHAVDCLIDEREPAISGATALRSTELIFGAWESARRQAQVHLPIEDVGNPLIALSETTEKPTPRELTGQLRSD